MQRAGIRSVLSACAAVGMGVVGAISLSDDPVVVEPMTHDPGTVELRVDTVDSTIGFSSMHVAGMRPGDTTAGVLTVANTGPVPLQYHVDAATSNGDDHGFGAALRVQVTGAATTVGNGRAMSCPGDRLPGTARRFTSMLVGSGQVGRTLAAGASETLCVQATLPLSSPSRLQGATTQVELEVVATP